MLAVRVVLVDTPSQLFKLRVSSLYCRILQAHRRFRATGVRGLLQALQGRAAMLGVRLAAGQGRRAVGLQAANKSGRTRTGPRLVTLLKILSEAPRKLFYLRVHAQLRRVIHTLSHLCPGGVGRGGQALQSCVAERSVRLTGGHSGGALDLQAPHQRRARRRRRGRRRAGGRRRRRGRRDTALRRVLLHAPCHLFHLAIRGNNLRYLCEAVVRLVDTGNILLGQAIDH
mmetsp:Transcript_38741/g.84561  ORF Transcript_38741/g.84561 Transcript_38741/m.84561 type:complete len:228 (+) Transcript_38741:241-924(+)